MKLDEHLNGDFSRASLQAEQLALKKAKAKSRSRKRQQLKREEKASQMDGKSNEDAI